MVRSSIHSVIDTPDPGGVPDKRDVRRPVKVPRFVWVAVVALLVGVAAVVAGFWYAHNAAVEQCERTVGNRADNRAMWEYLVAENDDPDSPRVVAFIDKLNERLPALECDGVRAVPVEENRG